MKGSLWRHEHNPCCGNAKRPQYSQKMLVYFPLMVESDAINIMNMVKNV